MKAPLFLLRQQREREKLAVRPALRSRLGRNLADEVLDWIELQQPGYALLRGVVRGRLPKAERATRRHWDEFCRLSALVAEREAIEAGRVPQQLQMLAE